MIDIELFLVSLRGHKDANGKAAPIYLADTLGEEIKIIEEALNYAGRRREWVGLTDDDILEVRRQIKGTLDVQVPLFARAIEAKLREKNSMGVLK